MAFALICRWGCLRSSFRLPLHSRKSFVQHKCSSPASVCTDYSSANFHLDLMYSATVEGVTTCLSWRQKPSALDVYKFKTLATDVFKYSVVELRSSSVDRPVDPVLILACTEVILKSWWSATWAEDAVHCGCFMLGQCKILRSSRSWWQRRLAQAGSWKNTKARHNQEVSRNGCWARNGHIVLKPITA